MFVKTALELPLDIDRVTMELTKTPRRWLHPLLLESRALSRLLGADVGADLAPHFGHLRLEVDSLLTYGNTAALPFQVRVDGAEQWAAFDNALTAGWLGDRWTQLAFEGRYPQSGLLSASQQTLLHRVIDATSAIS